MMTELAGGLRVLFDTTVEFTYRRKSLSRSARNSVVLVAVVALPIGGTDGKVGAVGGI